MDQVAPALSEASYALFSLGVVVSLMVTGIAPNVIAALIGCLMMGLFCCVDMDGAYRSISWKILLVIVGVMPFAVTLERTGGVDLAVNGLLHLVGESSPHVPLASLYVLTAAIGLFMEPTLPCSVMARLPSNGRKQPAASENRSLHQAFGNHVRLAWRQSFVHHIPLAAARVAQA